MEVFLKQITPTKRVTRILNMIMLVNAIKLLM